jgi:hypothetical protein
VIPAEGFVLALALALIVVVQVFGASLASRVGALLTTLAPRAMTPVVLHRCWPG